MISATSLAPDRARQKLRCKRTRPPVWVSLDCASLACARDRRINDSHLQHHALPRVSLLGGMQRSVSPGRFLLPTLVVEAGPGKTDVNGRSRSLSGSQTGRRFRAPRPPAAPSHQWEWEKCCPARA